MRPISTARKSLIQPVSDTKEDGPDVASVPTIEAPEEALRLLRSQPSPSDLHAALNYLLYSQDNRFNIRVSSPLAAQITNSLVNVIIPDYWRALREDYKRKGSTAQMLLLSLKSISGLGALLARLRSLTAEIEQTKKSSEAKLSTEHLEDTLQVLEQLIFGDDFVSYIWASIAKLISNEMQRTVAWKEFVSQTASGKMASLVAQAHDSIKKRDTATSESWIADGRSFARWLGRNLAYMVASLNRTESEAFKAASQLLGRTLGLGYAGKIASMWCGLQS